MSAVIGRHINFVINCNCFPISVNHGTKMSVLYLLLGSSSFLSAPFGFGCFLLFSQLICSAYTVNPACECIIFDGIGLNRDYGVFTSPNYPMQYEANVNCLLYTFVANHDEIVQLTFDDFDLDKSSVECAYGDYVKMFLHLDRPEVNENTRWNTALCGHIEDIDRTYYSAERSLIMEFHSGWKKSNHTGFRGTYKFINKKFFQTDGLRRQNTLCEYDFRSDFISRSSLSLGSSLGGGASAAMTGVKGRFFSPYYPSSYTKGSKCTYTFVARAAQRVKVLFENGQLLKADSSCLNSPDDIKIHDGRDGNSPVIGQLCNIINMVDFVSTGPYLYVEFNGRSNYPGQGFKGSYIFEDDGTTTPPGPLITGLEIPSTEPDKTGGVIPREKEEKPYIAVVLPKLTVPQECSQVISSDQGKNGTFYSPNYPDQYPAGVSCRYTFTGKGRERVQIIFTDFDLFLAHEENKKDCDGVDMVASLININGRQERVDNFCGPAIPNQLMSNGPTMTMEFHSMPGGPVSYMTSAERESGVLPTKFRGFHAIYKFVTNFGIISGRQDPQSVCGFVYNSTETSNGTFTSPNYPGYYPRDTECHYFFIGQHSEKIRLTFPYFDVEGVTPCSTVTSSDYVEFSNFRTVDRKLPRHCGMKKPTILDSDGDFFRVTFKSNDKFDGTGFEAFYEFRSHADPLRVKKIRSNASNVQRSIGLFIVLVLLRIVKRLTL